MHRKVWKWIFGISLTLLILLILFTVFLWALGNATGAMAGAIMGRIDPDGFGYRYLPFGEFLVNSIGSPIFYIGLTILAAHAASVVRMIVTRKHST